MREYASARNLNYRFAYKTVQLPYRPHARFECQVHIGEQSFEAGSDFATKSDAMYAAARVAIRTLMGETKSPEGDNSTRSRCDFESAWGNLTVPWWANTKILVDRLQNLGGFTYSYILNEICKSKLFVNSCQYYHSQTSADKPFLFLLLLANKITIPLNMQYKEIKEGEFIAQLVFLSRLFFTAQSHASERDAKQDLSRIIVWTLLGKIDHRTASRPVHTGQAMVTQAPFSVETTTTSAAAATTATTIATFHNQRDPISWADVVVRRTSISSSTAAHPGSAGTRSDSYDHSSVATTSPKTTTTAATSITAGDMSSVGFAKEFEYPQMTRQQQQVPTVYPFPRSARMPAALEVDNIHIDWPVANVLGCLNLDTPTQAEMDELSTSKQAPLLSELNIGSSLLSQPFVPSSPHSQPAAPWDRRSLNSSQATNTSSPKGWYHLDLSSRSKLLSASYTQSSSSKTRPSEHAQSSYHLIENIPASASSSFRHGQSAAAQIRSSSSSFSLSSPWQGSGSQAVMGLSEQAIRVKNATTRLSQFMQLVYPIQNVIHYDQVYTTE